MEGINHRIKEIILKENLTASTFADKIGVLRSGLSHILAGRNKPGADFIEKLLLEMPYVNANWLFTGLGDPYLNEVFRSTPAYLDSKSPVSEPGAQLDILNQLAEMFPEEYMVPERAKSMPELVEDKEGFEEEFRLNPVPKKEEKKKEERSLVKIIMVYSDSTFEELKPS